jgi:hypothetical protein
MMEQRPKRTEAADVPRVEYLLGLLKHLSQQDASPALRDRLEVLSSTRLGNGSELRKPLAKARSGLLLWLRPALVFALLVAIGIVAVLVTRGRQPERLGAGIESPVAPLRSHSAAVPDPLPAAQSPIARVPQARHSMSKLAQNTNARRMIVAFRIPIARLIRERMQPFECRCLKPSLYC